MLSLVILLISFSATLISYFLLKKSETQKIAAERILKIMAISFAVIGILRFCLADGFVEAAVTPMFAPHQSIARWLYYISYAVLPISVFFDSKLFKNLSITVCIPSILFSVIIFDDTMKYFMMSEGNGLMLPEAVRCIFYIIELSLALTIPLFSFFLLGHRVNFKDKNEILGIIIALPAMLAVMMPVYIPQSLVGFTNISHKPFSTLHLLWLLLMAVEIAVIILYFRKRSDKDKYLLCVFMTVAQFFNTMSTFLRGWRISRLPLQLCSIAAIFYIIAILGKKKKLFHFCYTVNIIGALIAIALASFSSGALCFWNIHYIYEHTFVLVIPILAMSLGVFPRLEKESLPYSFKVFSIYFLVCLIVGTVINGFSDIIGYKINFFYMLDVEVAVDYLPFAGFVGALEWQLGRFTVYPILVVVVYFAFVALCLLFFLATMLMYKLKDKNKNKKRGCSKSQPLKKEEKNRDECTKKSCICLGFVV